MIAGAGGHGREILTWVRSSPRFLGEHGIQHIAFINDVEPAKPLGAPLTGTIRDFIPNAEDLFICAIGDPVDRASVALSLEARGARFVSFIHDDALIGPTVTHLRGLVVFPRVTVSTDVRIGAHVHINVASSVSHDVTIGDFATLSPGCTVTGGATIEEYTFLGAGATVIPGRRVGPGATVGAQAAVVTDIAAGLVVVGVPARPLRETAARTPCAQSDRGAGL
ncbi:dTDP-4-amino-4,6-dideoxy-D-glucose acetyltransferase VioB [Microbacterium kyungheense]